MSNRKIFFCILEWTNNPAVILVETTDYPAHLIPFPSVTVCKEDNSLNPWNFLEKLLNFIKYPCYEDDEYALVSIIYSYRLYSEENAALTELVPFTEEPVTPLELQTR